MTERPGADDEPGDLPYVDGRQATPEQLRAEVARESDPQMQHIDELRDDVAATVEELGHRLDVRPRIAHSLSRVGPALVAAVALLVGIVVWRRRRTKSSRASPTPRHYLDALAGANASSTRSAYATA
jgi:hypothetical protein